jgi:4a-hydroxytetrahydrobiopterin dehydratase
MIGPSSEAPLGSRRCRPCEGGVIPLAPDKVRESLSQLPGWSLDPDGRVIRVRYRARDFASAIEAVRRIAELAEREDHHPDLHLTGYRKLEVCLSTHAIGGLSENDLILAAQISALSLELDQTEPG